MELDFLRWYDTSLSFFSVFTDDNAKKYRRKIYKGVLIFFLR